MSECVVPCMYALPSAYTLNSVFIVEANECVSVPVGRLVRDWLRTIRETRPNEEKYKYRLGKTADSSKKASAVTISDVALESHDADSFTTSVKSKISKTVMAKNISKFNCDPRTCSSKSNQMGLIRPASGKKKLKHEVMKASVLYPAKHYISDTDISHQGVAFQKVTNSSLLISCCADSDTPLHTSILDSSSPSMTSLTTVNSLLKSSVDSPNLSSLASSHLSQFKPSGDSPNLSSLASFHLSQFMPMSGSPGLSSLASSHLSQFKPSSDSPNLSSLACSHLTQFKPSNDLPNLSSFASSDLNLLKPSSDSPNLSHTYSHWSQFKPSSDSPNPPSLASSHPSRFKPPSDLPNLASLASSHLSRFKSPISVIPLLSSEEKPFSVTPPEGCVTGPNLSSLASNHLSRLNRDCFTYISPCGSPSRMYCIPALDIGNNGSISSNSIQLGLPIPRSSRDSSACFSSFASSPGFSSASIRPQSPLEQDTINVGTSNDRQQEWEDLNEQLHTTIEDQHNPQCTSSPLRHFCTDQSLPDDQPAVEDDDCYLTPAMDTGFIDLTVALSRLQPTASEEDTLTSDHMEYSAADEEEVGLAMLVESLEDSYDSHMHLRNPESQFGALLMSGAHTRSPNYQIARHLWKFSPDNNLVPFDFSTPPPAPSAKKQVQQRY